MLSLRISCLLLFFGSFCHAQQGWTWTELPSMPEPVANHAVTEAMSNDTMCVYSFCGIDSSKVYSGIHQRAFKYNTVSQEWTVLAPVPDDGKIAAGASVIQGKVYVAGGYYVFANGTEFSSDDLHVFDPQTDTWLADAPTIPTPIDDHVQTVYKDSLLMLVTGWSDTGNVNDVQLFDVTTSTWQAANAPPASTVYTAFGPSGAVIGEELFYLGGVSSSFSANSALRKGEINPLDATDISWSYEGQSPTVDDTYRSAATTYLDKIVWVGGAGIAYNFDGLAYSGGAGVPALDRILVYHPASDSWQEILGTPEAIMDLRGLAKVGENQWIVCGGMQGEQEVSDRAFLLTFDPSTSANEIPATLPWTVVRTETTLKVTCNEPCGFEVFEASGRLLLQASPSYSFQVDRTAYPLGSVIVIRSTDGQAAQGIRI